MQPTTLYKVRAHANIQGNEEADTLAKEGTTTKHLNASQPHEFAHSTPPKRRMAINGLNPGQRTH